MPHGNKHWTHRYQSTRRHKSEDSNLYNTVQRRLINNLYSVHFVVMIHELHYNYLSITTNSCINSTYMFRPAWPLSGNTKYKTIGRLIATFSSVNRNQISFPRKGNPFIRTASSSSSSSSCHQLSFGRPVSASSNSPSSSIWSTFNSSKIS
jgi:hypothetical protein